MKSGDLDEVGQALWPDEIVIYEELETLSSTCTARIWVVCNARIWLPLVLLYLFQATWRRYIEQSGMLYMCAFGVWSFRIQPSKRSDTYSLRCCWIRYRDGSHIFYGTQRIRSLLPFRLYEPWTFFSSTCVVVETFTSCRWSHPPSGQETITGAFVEIRSLRFDYDYATCRKNFDTVTLTVTFGCRGFVLPSWKGRERERERRRWGVAVAVAIADTVVVSYVRSCPWICRRWKRERERGNLNSGGVFIFPG